MCGVPNVISEDILLPSWTAILDTAVEELHRNHGKNNDQHGVRERERERERYTVRVEKTNLRNDAVVVLHYVPTEPAQVGSGDPPADGMPDQADAVDAAAAVVVVVVTVQYVRQSLLQPVKVPIQGPVIRQLRIPKLFRWEVPRDLDPVGA
jgi:hypothetical protein